MTWTYLFEIIAVTTMFALAFCPIFFLYRTRKKTRQIEKTLTQINVCTKNIRASFSHCTPSPWLQEAHKSLTFIKRADCEIHAVGIHENLNFDFFQFNNFFSSSSMILIDTETYEPNFHHILIKKRTWLRGIKHVNLEWNDFNMELDNHLTDHRQALEVLTPTFMSALYDLHKKYGDIELQYFEIPDYHKHRLAFIYKRNIFDITKDQHETDLRIFEDFATDSIALLNSI